MMITENNCEEYFLLYVDDELGNAERNAVEAFIRQHPQYAAALDVLLQTKLLHDNSVSFTGKEALYKNENSDIGINNYEEYFLLYTDNELSEKERENTERFVLQHPQLQPEFTLLQQMKLMPETIACPGKETLYKKEKKRRILPLYITRLSVAAAVAGIIAFTWQFVSTTGKTGNDTVAANTIITKKPLAQSALPTVLPEQKKDALQQVIAQQARQKTEEKTSFVIAKSGSVNPANKTAQQDIATAPVIHEEQPVAAELTQTALQKQPAVEIKNEPVATAALKPLEEVSEEETATQISLALSDDNNMVQPAVYKELKTDDDQTLYVGAFQLNKNKVNGFLKSASHLLGSRAKQGTD